MVVCAPLALCISGVLAVTRRPLGRDAAEIVVPTLPSVSVPTPPPLFGHVLLDDAKPEVCNAGCLHHAGALQFDLRVSQVVEKPDAFSEQDGHQVDTYSVDQPGLDTLLRDVGAARARTLVARGLRSPLDGALYAV